MRTKQTRKSVSISGELYEQLKRHCERESLSMSGYFEAIGRRDLGMPERTLTRKAPVEIGDPIDVPVTRKIARPVTKLKAQTAPQPEAVEVVSTSVHVAVDPKEQLRLDRAKHFKEWDKKQRTKRSEEEREASNIFTF